MNLPELSRTDQVKLIEAELSPVIQSEDNKQSPDVPVLTAEIEYAEQDTRP